MTDAKPLPIRRDVLLAHVVQGREVFPRVRLTSPDANQTREYVLDSGFKIQVMTVR